MSDSPHRTSPRVRTNQSSLPAPSAPVTGPSEESPVRDGSPSIASSQPIRRKPKHIQVEAAAVNSRPVSSGSSVYLGSYPRSPYRSRLSLDASPGLPTPRPSDAGSRRTSTGQAQLDHLLRHVDVDLDTYGVEELRDGFFDATFLPPPKEDEADLLDEAISTLPRSFHGHDPLSFYYFVPKQLHQLRSLIQRVTWTRSGIKLLKSFLGVFIAYVICLIPESRAWLGRYNYILVVSATLNHPGRSIGSQIDGAIFTILGTAAGIGWGSLALWVSTSTAPARAGYGGILAVFLIIFTGVLSWLRCIYIRIYQAVIPAGIAICYTCLANTSEEVSWRKIFNYAIPWVLGQAIGLIVSLVVFPSAGSRPLASSLHSSLVCIQKALALPRSMQPDTFLRRDLAWHFVDLSQAYRDFAIEVTVSRLDAEDIRRLRNSIQRVIKSTLAIKIGTNLSLPGEADETSDEELAINIENLCRETEPDTEEAVRLIKRVLSEPTDHLLDSMNEAISCSVTSLMKIIGYGKHLKPLHPTQSALSTVLELLRNAKAAFDTADAVLIGHPRLPSHLHKQAEVVELFLFVHPIRQTANTIEALILEIMDIKNHVGRSRVRWPSFPWKKAFLRSNAQVRHDRGGLTVGFFFQSKRQLDKMMRELEESTYKPARPALNRDEHVQGKLEEEDKEAESPTAAESTKLRYRLWKVLHRLQGFETRFAFKMAILTTLLSIPAWLPQSRDWWNRDDVWWSPVFVWIMTHPRVGGNFQDLITRSFFLILGALLGALSYAAASHAHTPYLLLLFFTLFTPSLLYRYTQSSHPRSGILACLTFPIISLSCLTLRTPPSPPTILAITYPRTLAILIGTTTAVLTNWLFSPFIARHALRKSLSTSLVHMGILYRHVLSTYIYPSSPALPSPDTIQHSEVVEAHLRESFVRLRSLLALTRHEPRLRRPFDPLPWSGLIHALESCLDRLVTVRQSSLYFRAYLPPPAALHGGALPEKRRDAIAALLMQLYVLAGALRSNRPVPRFLPSAAAARKGLLAEMDEVGRGVEVSEQLAGANHASSSAPEAATGARPDGDMHARRWADVYQYAYSSALTEIVASVEAMRRFTRKICGERGFDELPDVGR